MRNFLTGDDLVMPEYVCQGGGSEEGRGHRTSGRFKNSCTSKDWVGGLWESPSLNTSGSSVLEPHLQQRARLVKFESCPLLEGFLINLVVSHISIR